MDWLIDGLGVLGILTTIMVYQQKERKKMLIWKLITDAVWILHYYLLGGYSACAITIVAIFRSIVFLNEDKKWAQGKKWLYIFLAASLVMSLLAWQGPITLLTLTSSFICIVAYWLPSTASTRYLTLPAAVLYIIYTVLCKSREGFICELFILGSTVVGIIRHDIPRKDKKNA